MGACRLYNQPCNWAGECARVCQRFDAEFSDALSPSWQAHTSRQTMLRLGQRVLPKAPRHAAVKVERHRGPRRSAADLVLPVCCWTLVAAILAFLAAPMWI